MKALIVSYDLKTPGQNYSRLYEKLKRANAWWHYLDSTWLLYTFMSPSEWSEELRDALDKNDRILIIEVTSNYAGWLPNEAWDWINQYIPQNAIR